MIPQNPPREDAQATTEATRDKETPAGAEGGSEDLVLLWDRLESSFRQRLPFAPDTVTGLISDVFNLFRPELDRRDAEIAELQEAAAIAHDIATDRRCIAREAVHRAETAEAKRDQLDILIDEIITTYQRVNGLHQIGEQGNHCTTCQRTYPCPTVKALDNIDDRASAVIAERDQLKAVIAEVRALHAPHKLGHCIGCGMAEAYPCATTAVLDGAEHERLTLLRRVGALDQGHDDLPAVRAFAAKIDPRKEVDRG